MACLVEMEMSHMAGDDDDLYCREWRCPVWPLTEMSCMDGDGYMLYGQRRLLTPV